MEPQVMRTDVIGEDEHPQFAENLVAIVRGMCLFVGCLLLAVGCWFGLKVFFEVGTVIADPASASESVAAIAKMIDADKLVILQKDNRIEFGKTVAFGAFFVWHILWMWIPVSLLYAAGRIIICGLSNGRQTRLKK